jgi:hypothetical protein
MSAKSILRILFAGAAFVCGFALSAASQTPVDALYFVYDASKGTAEIINKFTGETTAVALIKTLETPPADCASNPWYAAKVAANDIEAVIRCGSGEKYALVSPHITSALPAGAKLLEPVPPGTDDPGPMKSE